MPLLILGASARAAAFSSLRAGLEPITGDLFADQDLAASCLAYRTDRSDYPDSLRRIEALSPPGPWLYTGALENHPALVDQIASRRPLWGIQGPALRAVRDPFRLAETLRAAGVAFPDVRESAEGVPKDGSWLIKPWCSAGGCGVRPWRGENRPGSRPFYYQRRIKGPSLSALFVGSQQGTPLLGVTRQWIGRPGMPFAYLGSLGPWPISEPALGAIEHAGALLGSTFGLLGLVGVDLILQEDVPWLLEVNPRYTASVEVLEHALGRSLLGEHQHAFDSNGGTRPVREHPRPSPWFVGKAIVFAPNAGRVPERLNWGDLKHDPWLLPRRADLPAPGSRFERGEPVLTILEQAATLKGCRHRLLRRLARWHERLRNWP